MTELQELQGQIEELKKTVNDLKAGTVRVETNVAKLDRLKGVCEFMAQQFNGFWGKEMKFIAGDVEHTSIL